MERISRIGIVTCLSICLAGCDEKTAPPPVPSAAAAISAPPQPVPVQVPEYKPEYALTIEESSTTPRQYTVTWSAKVNTGGWTMKTERVLVEEFNGAMAARIWVILEQPNPSDMTTQAFETITGKHDAGTTKIERAEFSVKRVVRGITYDTPAMYSVVKTIKYPY